MFEEIVIALTIAAAFWLEASIGFGAGLLSIPLLTIFMTASEAITLVMLFQFMRGGLVFLNWHSVNWPIFRQLALGVFVGGFSGTVAHAFLPHKSIAFLLGLLILLYVIRGRFFPEIGRTAITFIPKSLVGFLGGLIQGGFGIGGPIFVMYYTESIPERAAFRATLFATFLICDSIRLIVSIPSGLITAEVLVWAAYAFVPFVLALYLGQKYHARINEGVFRAAVDILLILSAVSLLTGIL